MARNVIPVVRPAAATAARSATGDMSFPVVEYGSATVDPSGRTTTSPGDGSIFSDVAGCCAWGVWAWAEPIGLKSVPPDGFCGGMGGPADGSAGSIGSPGTYRTSLKAPP